MNRDIEPEGLKQLIDTNNIEEFPFKSIFASDITKLETNALDTYISKASLDNLKPLMPSNIDFNINKDLIGCVLNAAVAGRRNANGDSISNRSAIRIAKNFINKYVNIGHKRDLIKGCIVNAGFSKFGSDIIMTEEEAANSQEPFNISVAFILWKTALNDKFINLLEASVNPVSDKYKCISGSWEILFRDYDIAIGNKNIAESQIITDKNEKESLEKFLQVNGGSGEKDGKYIYRIIKGESQEDFLIPAGIGLVENPAAEVKGLEIVSANDLNKKDIIIDAEITEAIKKEEEIQNISQSINNSVTNNNEIINNIMKITKIEDITEEVLKQSNASALVMDFINQRIREEDEKLKLEQNKVVAAQDSLTKTQTELSQVKASLEALQKKEEARAAAELHVQRMTYFDDTYELSSEERQAIASEIQNLDEESFTKVKSKFDIFLKEKSKAAIKAKKDAEEADKNEAAKKAMKSKSKDKNCDDDKDADDAKNAKDAKASADDNNKIIDQAIDNADDKKGIKVPNAGAPNKPLEEVWAEAFKLENCIVISKK